MTKEQKTIKGFTIRFLPYSDIRELNSDARIKKILNIVLGNNILIIQGKLRSEEESRLIGDTMAMIGHVPNFKGIELAVVEDKQEEEKMIDILRRKLANALEKGNLSAITIIGPASIVKEIKRDPKKIELFLNR